MIKSCRHGWPAILHKSWMCANVSVSCLWQKPTPQLPVEPRIKNIERRQVSYSLSNCPPKTIEDTAALTRVKSANPLGFISHTPNSTITEHVVPVLEIEVSLILEQVVQAVVVCVLRSMVQRRETVVFEPWYWVRVRTTLKRLTRSIIMRQEQL